jgi:hypothetical protein
LVERELEQVPQVAEPPLAIVVGAKARDYALDGARASARELGIAELLR